MLNELRIINILLRNKMEKTNNNETFVDIQDFHKQTVEKNNVAHNIMSLGKYISLINKFSPGMVEYLINSNYLKDSHSYANALFMCSVFSHNKLRYVEGVAEMKDGSEYYQHAICYSPTLKCYVDVTPKSDPHCYTFYISDELESEEYDKLITYDEEEDTFTPNWKNNVFPNYSFNLKAV